MASSLCGADASLVDRDRISPLPVLERVVLLQPAMAGAREAVGSASLEAADSSNRGSGWGRGTMNGMVHAQVQHAVHRRAPRRAAGGPHAHSKSHAHAAVQEVLCLAQIEAGEVESLGHDGGAAVVGAEHLLRRYSS